MTRGLRKLALGALLAGVALAPAGAATTTSIANRDSFRIGDSGVMCTAQSRPADPRLSGIFDRAYALTCRDAAGAVGSLLAVRHALDPATAPSAIVSAPLACAAPVETAIENVGTVSSITCRDEAAGLDYRRYAVSRGKVNYLVEGLAGYDPALKLALATVVTDQPQSGVVQVATTEVSNSAAFARIQAGSLDAASARAEAYARNNGGQFAESAEFFASVAGRDSNDAAAAAEALANEGLQQSNLSNFAAADRLLAEAERRSPPNDAVIQRLIRNYRALNQLNQKESAKALTELSRAVAPVTIDESEELRRGLINLPLAQDLNRSNAGYRDLAQLGSSLRPEERAVLLDAQAAELAAIAHRQSGQVSEAAAKLDEAARTLATVRDGRLAASSWLAADIAVERALVADASGNRDGAINAFDSAIALLQQNFPSSPMLMATRARKAGFLARTGDIAGARALFASVVEDSAAIADSGTALRNLLAPYFTLLAREGTAEAASLMFDAGQELQRPGVAQTQAVLARQMSEGNDDAAALFRLAVARTREISRTEAELAALTALEAPTQQQLDTIKQLQSALETMRGEQTSLQAKLADYPRYKVLAPTQTKLAELQAALRAGEGYYKMMVVGDNVYTIFATNGSARAMQLASTKNMLNDTVTTLRNSIVQVENGEQVIAPFDVDRARKLYLDLFGPVDSQMRGLKHLVFEPDGGMLQLPPYLLVASQAGIDAYKARLARPGADPFDMRGIDWLGRDREISISVSPRSFLDVRSIAPSNAREAYLGLGQNEPAFAKPTAAVADECDWPLAVWQHPISDAELVAARQEFGPQNSALITGAAFTDSALLNDPKLDEYRILHFATHGLVTAPRPDCPARPALVTSFGQQGSDGLLSFAEIFDLKLNADLVILSACDTAGAATAEASREAGILTGGNYALDGLVRAFVGAGARSVIASHWPVPDQFNATQRLITGLIDARPGEAVGDALARAQRGLMDDANTSHPFYWAAFIILGDGAKPLVSAPRSASAGAQPQTAR